jgi:quercetin dioxygenase-like cupin family protein
MGSSGSSEKEIEREIEMMWKKARVGVVLAIAALSFAAVTPGLTGEAFAQGKGKVVTANLDEILKNNPLAAGQPAKATTATRVPGAELQVIEMNKIKLHSHSQEDHIVFVARGKGTVRLDRETRNVKPGDIFMIPKDVSHGFSKSGDENLVLLVIGTPGWKPLEDTKFHE